MSKPVVAGVMLWGMVVGVIGAADPPAPQLDPQAMHEMFMKLGQPGPQHERLKSMVGTWNCVCRNYEGNADQPVAWQATAVFKPLFGGRYIQQEFSGEMPGNIKYSGQGLMGYDNAQQKHVGTWVDSMSTGIMHTEGTYDEATRTVTETGSSATPFGVMKFQMVTQHKSDDQFLFTMSMVAPEGDPQKMMEIEYTRKQD